MIFHVYQCIWICRIGNVYVYIYIYIHVYVAPKNDRKGTSTKKETIRKKKKTDMILSLHIFVEAWQGHRIRSALCPHVE